MRPCDTLEDCEMLIYYRCAGHPDTINLPLLRGITGSKTCTAGVITVTGALIGSFNVYLISLVCLKPLHGRCG